MIYRKGNADLTQGLKLMKIRSGTDLYHGSGQEHDAFLPSKKITNNGNYSKNI